MKRKPSASADSHRKEQKFQDLAVSKMPVGMMLVDDEFKVEWVNSYLLACFDEELVGRTLHDISPPLIPLLKHEGLEEVIDINDQKFKVVANRKEHLLYFCDVTNQVKMDQSACINDRTVLAYLFFDNYDEVSTGMDDDKAGQMLARVGKILKQWSKHYGIYIRRVSDERIVAVFTSSVLQRLEKDKFSVLDEIREKEAKAGTGLTLSIGIGADDSSLHDLGYLTQSSLDLALGRGGDQVVIKEANGKVKFYGGKTNPIEKQTRVRARVVANALRDLMRSSEQVFVMGHKYPDMDAIGSSIGVLKIAQLDNIEAFIVVDEKEVDASVQRLFLELKKYPDLWGRFISSERAMKMMTTETLVVVVDTNKASLAIEERLLDMTDHIVVIDHHRRGDEFIDNQVLVYIEPYASSTAELIAELLDYQTKKVKLSVIEATSLLAGIIVDTKSFTLRTGSRTFGAASYLRTQGADTVLVQQLLKENFDVYIRRAKLIENTHVDEYGVAIAKATPAEIFNPALIAQAADTLLSLTGINASFVISKRHDGAIGISARSLGEVNVQMIMETLGGGGHLTNAATQLREVTIDEAEQLLIQAINDSRN